MYYSYWFCVLQVTGSSDQTIKQLLAGLVFEFSLEQPGYYLGGSLAEIDENSTIGFVEGDIVIVQEDRFCPDQKYGKYSFAWYFLFAGNLFDVGVV